MPKALAEPKPVAGWGLLLAPAGKLSKVQAVMVVAALVPDSEARSSVTIETIILFFIKRCLVCLLYFCYNRWLQKTD
jgi:hypothetical protein